MAASDSPSASKSWHVSTAMMMRLVSEKVFTAALFDP
jgi:hypothetical protein